MRIRVLLFAGFLVALSLIAAPANAATNQISGTALLDTAGPAGQCPAEPIIYGDYPAIVMTGSLDGCWYTNILTQNETPSGGGIWRAVKNASSVVSMAGPRVHSPQPTNSSPS